ncbi:hypothetical protein OJ996_10865 [Luteolibacter sp. GHJ8]|uniref:Type II toxin-antitoxin system RelE/ParE family toxin n=1 Tax=Luteolibacter rhizosphaerae TaxID=2989719 RepID=A0ABT3G3G0_9BACT|nr:hypothetical protein [Luteolibacter rhizosphaerae]MCW1914079.1 hypothetical protein [Luteolibacter rhizosphaerae]
MSIQLLDLARNDLLEGYRFYEQQESGLGDYFLDSLFSDIDSLRLHAGIHRRVHRDLHRSLSKRFPFAIYYKMTGDRIQVHAIVDCRRNPAWIRRHLGGT